MDRFRSALALATALAILIPTGAALAVIAYTTDTQEIALRATPSTSGKILLNVPPASGVELVNPNVIYQSALPETRRRDARRMDRLEVSEPTTARFVNGKETRSGK